MNPRPNQKGLSKMSTYNGWTNYETWNLNLWMDGDEYLRELAQGAGDLREAEETVREYIEELAEMLFPGIFDGEKAAFVGDMFSASLREVNWVEIAEHYRDEMEMEAA